ncbi:hypothetical protein MAR_005144 [Mya arenaria]|uniref:DinB family protein n=1 Tax=Mya arenaria TaxID=6604 RepID=A0ABY7F1E8_MYAAR|nr:hypothetical protein MAR_005144 [Mya arenaria]
MTLLRLADIENRFLAVAGNKQASLFERLPDKCTGSDVLQHLALITVAVFRQFQKAYGFCFGLIPYESDKLDV